MTSSSANTPNGEGLYIPGMRVAEPAFKAAAVTQSASQDKPNKFAADLAAVEARDGEMSAGKTKIDLASQTAAATPEAAAAALNSPISTGLGSTADAASSSTASPSAAIQLPAIDVQAPAAKKSGRALTYDIDPKKQMLIGSEGQVMTPNTRIATPGEHTTFSSPDGMTTKDFWDTINPLQNLPIVGSIYREITGEKISPGSRALGGMLYGGPLGLIAAAFSSATENETGHDIGGTLIALVKGDKLGPADPNAGQLANASTGVSDVPAAPVTSAAQPVSVQRSAADAAPAAKPVAAPGSFGGIAAVPTSAKGGMPVNGLPGAQTQMPQGVLGTTDSGLPAAGALTRPSVAMAINSQPGLADAEAQAKAALDAPQNGSKVDNGRNMSMPQRTHSASARMPGPGREREASTPLGLAQPSETSFNRAVNDDRAVILSTPAAPTTAQPATAPAAALSTSAVQAPPPVGNPADAMSRALDKYDALIRSRKAYGGNS